MRSKIFAVAVWLTCASLFAADAPLRVFLRVGKKTHGPAGNGQHDGPTFLKDWTKLLTERGAVVNGRVGFPTGEEFEKTDVLVLYTEEGGKIAPADRENLDKFLKRGGGIVAIHDSVCGDDAQWWKTIIGGAWEHGYSKWLEADVPIYYVDNDHPITKDASNFDFNDEIYYDLHMMPEVKILAGSWTPDPRNSKSGRPGQHIYDVSPQMWTYEKDGHRAFVCVPGHHLRSFAMDHFRAVILRGIAWSAKRDVDLLCSKEELASLKYPEGGPSSPAKELTQLELHPDFKVSVVAAEPLINKPIAIDWDAAGRMWVAETPEYPNGRRGIKPDQADVAWKDHGGLFREPGKQDRPAKDRISILIDSDGDGVADRKEVFYEGLELVTGFVFYKDGVIVSQAPDILWLRDTDNDGKADKVEKLYVGLGTQDTHAVINNLRWGLDGWVYATHGYSAGTVTSLDGRKDFGRISSGVVRFKPDGSAFEQYCSKGGNTWGLDITAENDVLFTQPTSDDLLNHVVLPESSLARGRIGNTPSYKVLIYHRPSNPLIKFENLAYVQIDLVGLFTAAAGCAIYEHGSWPTEWTHSYFTTEPTINIVHHEIVKPVGVSFAADKTRDEEFVGGRDKWFRPIETRIGPDGALYVLDFYNQAVIHNDTRGPKHNGVNAAVRPDRDHYFGRVLRIDHKQAKQIPVPNLAKMYGAEVTKALEHPNRAVRFTAQRLIVERRDVGAIEAMKQLPKGNSDDAPRIHRLWALQQLNDLSSTVVGAALVDKSPAVRKTGAMIAAIQGEASPVLKARLIGLLKDTDPRTRLEAVNALASFTVDKETCDAVVAAYVTFDDPWLQSAAVGVLMKNPVEAIASVLGQPAPEKYGSLASLLVGAIAQKGDAEAAAALVIAAAKAPASADALKVAIFETLSRDFKANAAPKFSDSLRDAFGSALKSKGTVAAALPLVARWDKENMLAAEATRAVQGFLAKLSEGNSDRERAQAAASLLGARRLDAQIVPAVTKLLGSSAAPNMQVEVVQALGATADPAIGKELVAAFPRVSPQVREAMFTQIARRADWSSALVDALKSGQVTLQQLGPPAVHRLRTHPDVGVAAKALSVIEELRGPEAKEKNTLIAKLTPEVEKPGNAVKGKELFTQNCAVCHLFNGEGKQVGPDLTGMGAHGPAELLAAILDPNREVDPSFVAWNIETKDDESYDGVIAAENRGAITLRNNSGEMQIKTATVKSRSNTGKSLMPEGFEALGNEALRDILTYFAGGDQKYRIIDLRPAFTADTSRGLFHTQTNLEDTLRFRSFGLVKAGGVPFEIINPTKTASGNNIVVLKGGVGFARTRAQRVEVSNVNVKASRLHVLGGIAGWGWPCCGVDGNKGMPAGKIVVSYADGQTEEFQLINGVDVADHVGPIDVPGSKGTEGIVSRGQLRSITRNLSGKAPIQKIALESSDNAVAPTFVAMTLETGEPAGKVADASGAIVPVAPKGLTPPAKTDGMRVLLVGGGSSHDFNKWFNNADRATLADIKPGWIDYTDKMSAVNSALLANVDVLVWSANQAMPDETKNALLAYVNAGKPIVLLHPGLWYNWKNFTEWNKDIVGGGARGHDKFGEFEVKVTNAQHPVMAGVPEQFKITDELYNTITDTNGTPMDVLAQATSPTNGKTFPQVWIVKHPKARIVAITLGHDAKAHELPAFKTLLKNAVNWAAGK